MKIAAFPLPVSMQDDVLALRAQLEHIAAREGVTVPEGAPIVTAVLTDRFDPEIRALRAEVEAQAR